MSTLVTKFDGTKEPYNEEKIRGSSTRVGVPVELQSEMLASIRDRLYDSISTREIFVMIKEFLKKSGAPHLAMKYNLKAALAELGPSGYPFEKFLSALLSAEGYDNKINQIIAGSCVTHEVDAVAVRGGVTYFIEAKFHTSVNQRTDVKVVLYIKARYDDLASAWKGGPSKSWIVTNTRFSSDAIKYGECQNIILTSWGYPKGGSIAEVVERNNLWPITIIEDMSKDLKLRLLNSGVVTCGQLLDRANASLLPNDFRNNILPNLAKICQNQKN